MSKVMSCSKVIGFVGGNNTRNAWPWLAQVKAVMFRSELTGEDDTRTVIAEMILGEKATDETRKLITKWVKEYDSEGPASQWALTNSILRDGQQEPCKVTLTPEGILLFSGARRWFGNLLASVLLSSHKPEFLADPSEANEATARELGHILNASHKELTVIDEARQYHELKELGLSDRAIAERLNVFDKGGKPNVQRVGQYRKLFSPKITDAQRAKLANGTATIDSLLKIVNTKTGSAAEPSRQETRPRTMTYKALEPLSELKTCRLIQAAKQFAGDTEEERIAKAIQYGMRLALQKDVLPKVVQDVLTPTEPEAELPEGEVIGGDKKKTKKKKRKSAVATATTEADAPAENTTAA